MSRDSVPLALSPLLTKLSQVLKTINACFVAIAPAKVERIAADDGQVLDLEFIGNHFRFQRPPSRPFIHALGTWAHASQSGGVVITDSFIRPGDSQLRITLLRNLAGLDRLSSLCYIHDL